VRDTKEVVAGKGGPPSFIFGSVNVPLNIDGKKQSDHATSQKEFAKKLKDAGLTLTNKDSPIITHCGSGGRGSKAQQLLEDMGYSNVHNGGSTANIYSVLGLNDEKPKAQANPTNKSYKKPSYLDDEYDHLSQPGLADNIEDTEFLPDYMVKDAPEYKRN